MSILVRIPSFPLYGLGRTDSSKTLEIPFILALFRIWRILDPHLHSSLPSENGSEM